METAIRNALSRSDRNDPSTRARIYQSARQALDAGLKRQDITDAEVIVAQQARLEELILQIESEEEARSTQAIPDLLAEPYLDIAPGAPMPSPNSAEATSLGGQTRDRATSPSVSQKVDEDFSAMRAEPSQDRLAPNPAAAAPRQQKQGLFKRKRRPVAPAAPVLDTAPLVPGEQRKRRKRGLISRLFIYLIFSTFIAMGGWWAYTAGLFMTAAERDTSVPNPPASVREEDFSGAPSNAMDPKQGFSADWLEIYGNTLKGKVTSGTQAKAETIAMADGPALRITSASPDAAGDVGIEVPVEVLRELAGKTSTIALTLQAGADQSVQLAVRCEFSSLGNCSRHRVMATQERSDTLFRVTFDKTLAPTQPGRILINSDILGSRQPIVVYSIRVLPGQ
nr:hypothetical protein [Rhizobium lemnae]